MAAARTAAAYPLLLALGALDATGYSVIVPVAPAIAEGTSAGPATIGLLVASFPAGMVVGFALAGWAVRRHGSRALLVVSLALVAVGSLAFVVGDSLGVYFVARTLMVVWSQVGIIGYMLGPLAGGIVADGAGYGYVWLIPAAAGLLVLPVGRRQATPA